VFRHESGSWAVRFTCGAGHIHEERVGTVKTEAIPFPTPRRRRKAARTKPPYTAPNAPSAHRRIAATRSAVASRLPNSDSARGRRSSLDLQPGGQSPSPSLRLFLGSRPSHGDRKSLV